MKKLVVLLVLSLCLSGVSAAALGWRQSACAETTVKANASQKDRKDKASKKDKKSKKEKAQKAQKSKQEETYTYDLKGRGTVKLSKIFKSLKLDVEVSAVKEIESESEGLEKFLKWERGGKHKKDFVFTVLKDFDEAEVRVKLKKTEFLLKLKNAAVEKPNADEKETEVGIDAAPVGDAPAPSAETPEEAPAPAEPTGEGDGQGEPTGDGQGEPTGDSQGEPTGEGQGEPTGDGQGEPTDDGQGEPTGEGQGEPTGDSQGEPTGEGQGEPTGDGQGEPSGDGQGEPSDDGQGEPEGEGQGAPAGESEGEDNSEGDDPEAGEGAGEGDDPEAVEPPAEGDTPGAEDGGNADPAPALPEDAEAWFEKDGVQVGGTLSDTVKLLEGGEKVYIRSKATMLLKDAPLKQLGGVTLLPDETVFKGDYAVFASLENPASVETPELVDLKKPDGLGDSADLYIWVAKEEIPAPVAEPTQEPTPVITVKAKHYKSTEWTNRQPTFTFSGIPADMKDWTYAAIVYDERFIPISGPSYSPLEEGRYTLRFAMLNGIGDIISISDQYIPWLDWTEPDVGIEVDEKVSYRLNIVASDELSGVKRVSLDKGKTWSPLENDVVFTYTGKEKKTFKAGSIWVEDVAGNLFVSSEDYTVEKVEKESGGGGGGGGTGEKKPVLSHASGDGEEGVEYDALELEIPDEPMEQLTVGGEAMDMTLLLESAQTPEAPVGENQCFTATLTRWNGRSGDQAPDTLLLDAELDANLGDEFVYDWHFNGEVYRALANSGIKYVALKVGDHIAAFPTEGFTGGTKYTELKMLGVSTRRFDYTLSMKVNLNPGHVSAMSDSDYSQACDLSIRAEVENMNYELSNSPKSIMYFYDVYLGPEDMLNQPFGEYKSQT